MRDANNPYLGRPLCAAVAHATGLPMVRDVSIAGAHDDVAEITVRFIATAQQMASISEWLSTHGDAGTTSKPSVPKNVMVSPF